MAVSGEVLSGVMEGYKKTSLDGNYAGLPLFDYWKKAGGIKEEGGRNITVPVTVAEHSSGIDLVTGREPVVLATSDIQKRLIFDWARGVHPITLSGKDKAEYSTDKAIINYMQTLLTNVREAHLRSINSKIIANTGSLWSDLITFNGMSTGGGGVATGIFRPAAFGSQTGGLGQLTARDAFGNALQHQFGDAADDFSANGRSQLAKIIRSCRKRSIGGKGPSVILMSDEGYSNLFDGIVTNERHLDSSKMVTSGPSDFVFMGIPVAFEDELPTSATADEEVTAYVLNLSDSLHLNYIEWLKLGPWISLLPGQYDGEGCQLTSHIAVSVQHMPSLGVLVDGNTL